MPERAVFPAERQGKGELSIAERSLTANMTGQVRLAGIPFDLQFNKGYLKKISRDGETLLDKFEGRSYFRTDSETLEFRNESAFAFESDPEYGLRTLQVPKRRTGGRRIITDYIFNRETEECLITAFIEYPDFADGSIVTDSAPFELRFRLEDRELSVGASGGKKRTVESEEETGFFIEGKSFEIEAGGAVIELRFRSEYRGQRFTEPDKLEVKTETNRRRRYLLVNPGGSYTPAPADYYSGAREQICLQLNVRKL